MNPFTCEVYPLKMHHEHSFDWEVLPLGVIIHKTYKKKHDPSLPWVLTLKGGYKETEKVFYQCNFFSASFPTRRAAVEALCLACGVSEKDISIKRSGYRCAGYWLTSDGKLSISNHHDYPIAWDSDQLRTWRVAQPEVHEPEDGYPEVVTWLKSKGLFEVEFATRAKALTALQDALAN